MDIIPIVGFSIIAAAISLLLKQYKPEFSMGISLAVGVVLFFFIISSGMSVFNTIIDLLNKTAVPVQYSVTVFKALGICFITQIASDSCKDAGESAIASKVELAGKMAILILAVPLFENLINMVIGLLSISG